MRRASLPSGPVQVLDRLLEQADSRHETFAKLAMANLHAYSAPPDRRKEDSIKRAEVHYGHALELYRRVLEKDEGELARVCNGEGHRRQTRGLYPPDKIQLGVHA